MNVNNVVRTITIKGVSDGVEKLTNDVNKLAAAQQNVAVVSETTAKRVLSLEDAWKKQTLKLDEAARSQANIARETKIADGALREGLITQQQHAERLNLIGQRYSVATVQAGKFAAQTGLNRYEMLNLSRQMQDVGVSLAGGQSPFVVLTQQGSQILDVFQATNGTVRGFFSQAISWAGRFVASTAGVVTGVLGIGAGALYAASSWQESQREIDRALIGIGRRSGVTVNDINQIARTSATATGLSVGEARDAAVEFAKTGAIYKDNIKAAVDTTHNFAIATGQDAKEAAKSLGAALADPAAGADNLNNKLGFLDGRTRELVISLSNQNRVQEAQKILLDGVAASTARATDTLGPFEKAWAAVGNAASRAKNAVGAALSPNTDQENLDGLRGRRQQLTSGTGVGLFNQLGNRGEIARLDAEINKLEESLRRAAAAAADDRFKQFSVDADNAVRAVIPQIQQIQNLEKALADIRRAQSDPNVGSRQGLGASNVDAGNAIEVQLLKLKESSAEAARYNQRVLEISKSYGNVGISTAIALEQLRNQLPVAQAVTGQQQIQAQYQATINTLLDQGKTATEAMAIAEAQRAISVAQVNAQVQQQTIALEQQTELIRARQTGTEAAVAAEQAYSNAIAQGAGSRRAAQLADAVYENQQAQNQAKAAQQQQQVLRSIEQQVQQQAQANQGVEDQIYNNEKQIELLNVRSAGEEVAIKGAHAYNDALRAGADLLHAQAAQVSAIALAQAQLAKEEHERARAAANAAASAAGGDTRNVGRFGYANFVESPIAAGARNAYGAGGFDPNTLQPNAQGIANLVNTHLAGGRTMATAGWESGVTGAIEGLLSGSGPRGGVRFGAGGLSSDVLSVVQQLIDVLPDDKSKAVETERALGLLRAQPQTIETLQSIKSLEQSLKQLTEATNANTQAITDVLSPFYSSDPRRTHLGFRAFAGGGIMSPWGELPINKYAVGGVANSPQVAVFGEGRTPEAYVPVPSGRIPVVIQQPANSNDKAPDIKVFINVEGNATSDTVNALKSTAFQQAQSMRRALRG